MTNSSNQKAYNLTTTGFGYLNRIRYVQPKQGNKYLAVNLALLEGVVRDNDYNALNRTYYDARIVGSALETIETLFEFDEKGFAILPDNSIVTATVKMGGCNPVIYPIKKQDGTAEDRVSLRTRLYGISWLKVGDTVLHSLSNDSIESDSDATGHVDNTDNTVDSSTTASDQPTSELSENNESPVEQVSNEESVHKVTLDRKDPDFEAKKQKLKDSGYKWNKQEVCWELPINSLAA